MAKITFEATLPKVVPWWLRSGVGGEILRGIGVLLDGRMSLVSQAVRRRLPGQNDDALPLLARDRVLRRGPAESAEQFAIRLRRWLTDHALRGNPYALLAQLHAFYTGGNFQIDLVYRSGKRLIQDALGEVTRDYIDWEDFDEDPELWGRWWLFYHADSLEDATASELATVPTDWGNAHTNGNVVVLYAETELWGYPPGTVDDEDGSKAWTDDEPVIVEL